MTVETLTAQAADNYFWSIVKGEDAQFKAMLDPQVSHECDIVVGNEVVEHATAAPTCEGVFNYFQQDRFLIAIPSTVNVRVKTVQVLGESVLLHSERYEDRLFPGTSLGKPYHVKDDTTLSFNVKADGTILISRIVERIERSNLVA